MNWPSDAPQWFKDTFENLAIEAKGKIISGKENPERSAGFFACVSRLEDLIEGAADEQKREAETRMKKALKAVSNV